MNTSERIYAVIKKKDISQAELAKSTGATRQTINGCIRGRHQLRLDTAVLIASALHVSVDYLLGLNNREIPASKLEFDVSVLPKNLEKAIKNRGQSNENFAKEAKVGKTTLYQVLKGEYQPSIKTFCAIINTLDVSADSLLATEEKGAVA